MCSLYALSAGFTIRNPWLLPDFDLARKVCMWGFVEQPFECRLRLSECIAGIRRGSGVRCSCQCS